MPLIPLIEHLPRHAEEGHLASEVDRAHLIATYSGDPAIAAAEIALLERLLCALGLLDEERLANGIWRFPSYPANLAALSLLTVVANPSQRYLPSHFWQGGQIPDSVKEQQRGVLRWLEDQRWAGGDATPIRTVHAAWGVIKLDGTFLLHRREDIRLRHEEGAGDYNLPGGRCNSSDLQQQQGGALPTARLLEQLQQPRHPLITTTLYQQTLPRELAEELGLATGEYQLQPWFELPPWEQCQGTAPNYALSRYYLSMFTVTLTTIGYLKVKETMNRGTRFYWATLGELMRCRSEDGLRTFYLQILFSPDRRDRVAHDLAALPESYPTTRQVPSDEHLWEIGKAGLRLDHKGHSSSYPWEAIGGSLGQEWLLLLAASLRGWPLEGLHTAPLHQFDQGWLQIENATLFNDLIELGQILVQHNLFLLEFEPSDHLVRLALPPEQIYLDPDYFHATLHQHTAQHWRFQLKRRSIHLFGELTLAAAEVESDLSPLLAMELEKIAVGSCSSDSELPRKVRSSLQPLYRSMGLLRWLGKERGVYRYYCPTQYHKG